MMPTLVVAGANLSITRIGLGCARIHGRTELRAASRLIEAALGAGIRHFDTAPSYGEGQSEAVLGAVLAGIKDVTITTKVGIPRPDRVSGSYAWPVLYRKYIRPIMTRFPGTKTRLLRRFAAGPDAALTQNTHSERRRLTREQVLRELDHSLKQLRRSSADLYLIHEPDQFELTDELREVLGSLQRAGMVSAYGLAWSRVGDTRAEFGSVRQGRYGANLPTRGMEGETRIFHGVLRYPSDTPNEYATMHAGARLRGVLDAHPDAAVIFSASTPGQIRHVMQQL
jgi:aryl-alcohol dehydrogenase-like predicted oxidoreductase